MILLGLASIQRYTLKLHSTERVKSETYFLCLIYQNRYNMLSGCAHVCQFNHLSHCNKTALKIQEDQCLGLLHLAYEEYSATEHVFKKSAGKF